MGRVYPVGTRRYPVGETNAADGYAHGRHLPTTGEEVVGVTPIARATTWVDGRSRWQRWLLLYLVFTVVAAPFLVLRIMDNTRLGLWDEWQYVDTIHSVSHGDLFLRGGEPLSGWAWQLKACRGIEVVAPPDPVVCRSEQPAAYVNSASIDPPSYFLVTAVGARAITAVGLTDDLLLASRLVGIAWAGLAMTVLFALARMLGSSRAAATLAAGTVITVPLFAQQYYYVTPHATDIVVGCLAAIMALRWYRREWGWWVLPVIALGAVGFKLSNITAVALIGLYLLALACWPTATRQDRLRTLGGGVLLAVSTAALASLWLLIQHQTVLPRARLTAPPAPTPLDPRNLIANSTVFISNWGLAELLPWSGILIAAMLGTALVVWSGLTTAAIPERALAAGYVLASILGPTLLVIMIHVSTTTYVPTEVRYGMALFPIGIALASGLLRTRFALIAATVYLGSYYAFTLLLDIPGQNR